MTADYTPTHVAYALRREGKRMSRWLEIGKARLEERSQIVHVMLDRTVIGGFSGYIYLSRLAQSRPNLSRNRIGPLTARSIDPSQSSEISRVTPDSNPAILPATIKKGLIGMEFKTIQEIERAIDALPQKELAELYAWLDRHRPTQTGQFQASVFEQGVGLFGSPDDAALLDEVVRTAYEERSRPSRPVPAL